MVVEMITVEHYQQSFSGSTEEQDGRLRDERHGSNSNWLKACDWRRLGDLVVAECEQQYHLQNEVHCCVYAKIISITVIMEEFTELDDAIFYRWQLRLTPNKKFLTAWSTGPTSRWMILDIFAPSYTADNYVFRHCKFRTRNQNKILLNGIFGGWRTKVTNLIFCWQFRQLRKKARKNFITTVTN